MESSVFVSWKKSYSHPVSSFESPNLLQGGVLESLHLLRSVEEKSYWAHSICMGEMLRGGFAWLE